MKSKVFLFAFALLLPFCAGAQTTSEIVLTEQAEKARKELQSVLNVLEMAADMSKLDKKGMVLKTVWVLYPNLKARVQTESDLQAVGKEGAMRDWIIETVSVPIFAHYKAEGAKIMLREFLMAF